MIGLTCGVTLHHPFLSSNFTVNQQPCFSAIQGVCYKFWWFCGLICGLNNSWRASQRFHVFTSAWYDGLQAVMIMCVFRGSNLNQKHLRGLVYMLSIYQNSYSTVSQRYLFSLNSSWFYGKLCYGTFESS